MMRLEGTSTVDADRDEARSARLAAWRSAKDEHAYECACRACLRDRYDAAEEAGR